MNDIQLLLACPFCGSNEIGLSEREEDSYSRNRNIFFAIVCPKCDTRGPEELDKTCAVDKWNSQILYKAILTHQSQHADDRCWMDDQELYKAAGLVGDNHVGNPEAMLENCKRFIKTRCQGGNWVSYAELEAENVKLKELLTKAQGLLTEQINSIQIIL